MSASQDAANEPKLLVLTLEGLATGALGCYGSSWNSTPNIDSIASVGCVWDRWIATSDQPLEVFRESCGDDEIWQHWRPFGRVELVTDDQRLADQGLDHSFDQTSLIAMQHADQPAETLEATRYGQLVAAALERADQRDPWSVLWLHSRFLTECWDAPRTLLDSELPDDFLEEPSEEVELLPVGPAEASRARLDPVFLETSPPAVVLDPSSHPDLITSWMTTYGCQIRLIDDLIGVILRALGAPNLTVALAGTSGFSFGQNNCIGHRIGPLRSCHARLPLVIGCGAPIRSQQIAGTDSFPQLIDALSQSTRPIMPDSWIDQDSEFEPRVTTHGDQHWGVTTSGWFLVSDEDEQQKLFLKPDDVEDANDVFRLRPDVVQRLTNQQAH